jgi:hypothetical protein
MAKRTYRARNKTVELDELDDLVAVRSDGEAAAGEPVLEGYDPFRKGGWHLVPRDSAAQRAAQEEGLPVARILRKQRTGDLVLSLARATVKFADDTPRAEVDAALRRAGATVVEELRMAKNLYTVEFERERDVFAGLAELADTPGCEFAEPELVAPLAGR